jgi:threo-3-hydroxy-L-aspartate ammonia-lyase
MPQYNSVTITDVQAAQKRILGIAHRTPVLTSRIVNDRTNSQVFFRHLQKLNMRYPEPL